MAGREGTDLLVYDEEYAEMLGDEVPPRGRWRAWVEDGDTKAEDTLECADRATATARGPPRPGTGAAG